MKNRQRKAHFRLISKGEVWICRWLPLEQRLTLRKRHTRTQYTLSAESLVDVVEGQYKLL